MLWVVFWFGFLGEKPVKFSQLVLRLLDCISNLSSYTLMAAVAIVVCLSMMSSFNIGKQEIPFKH